jgi:divalent metal cation (Fe/Co/Zn/Cd) transporter
MKKIIVIFQLIIGIIVVLFALTMFWQAFVNIFEGMRSLLPPRDLPILMTVVRPSSSWLQLFVSLFIFQVVIVYTKQLFDSLSVSE